jgi:hypothetical protein
MKTQAKVLKLNDEEGILEGNLMEIPFINYNKKSDIKIIEYTWVDSNEYKRGIEVRGSVQHGLPTAFEFDVICAFFRLYFKKKKTYCNTDNDIKNEKRYVEFYVSELAEEMGYADINGKILDSIKNSIECLVETTLYSRYDGGLLDVKTNKYKRDCRETAFHILNGFELITKNNSNHARYTIEIDKFFFESVTNNYFNYYSVPLFQEIRNSVAKKIFFILLKWKSNRGSIRLYNDTLFKRIPLLEDVPRYRNNEKLKRAFESLKDVGFLKDYEMTTEYTDFIFADKCITNELQ